MASLNNAPTRPAPGSPCPCGSGKSFDSCCEPVIDRKAKASSAQNLMRARFSAHVVKDQAFLHHSYQGTTNKPFEAQPVADATKWSRLEIHVEEPGRSPELAHVDFTAYFEDGGKEFAHHEKAEFTKASGEWIYTRALRLGPAPVKATAPKVGRNDPCPCGSGKKFKHCCDK